MGTALFLAGLVAGVRIHDVQGAGHRSPLVDRDVAAIEGVVTQLGPHAFYMQDPEPDDDDATSEGVRVSSDAAVKIGDFVEVSGVVREVRPGCASCVAGSEAFANLTTTEIEATEIAIVDVGRALPRATRIGAQAGERRPPSEIIDEGTGDVEAGGFRFDPVRHGLDFYESLEGMLVEVDHARAVGPSVRVPGRGSQIAVVANGGAGAGPFTSRGGLLRRAGDDNPERILVVGDLGELDVGDGWNGPIIGVMDYAFGHFELVAGQVPAGLSLAPPRAVAHFAPPDDDDLTLATFNVENLGPANPAEKFEGIAEIVVVELGAPDLVVLEEIQDDSGPLDDGTTDAADTYAALVDAIAARGGPAYTFRDVAPVDAEDGGQPGGNIRVGFLVRTDRGLSPIDRAGGARDANAVRDARGPELVWSPGRIDPENAAFSNSRKPVGIELRFHDRPLFVLGVHFNSQIGDAPLFGRFQPADRPTRRQRTEQAHVVADFVRQILAIDPRAAVVVAGDMNDGEESPPLAALAEAGLSSAIVRVPENDRYSYVFQGNAEIVDHVLVSSALAQNVTDVRIAHANADFAHAASDHDPVVVRISRWGPSRGEGACRCGISSSGGGRGQEGWPVVFAALLARRGQKRGTRRCRRFLSRPTFSGNHPRP